MRLSNKSTFSLACLILLMAFVALPAMAHDPGDGTPDASHDVHPVNEAQLDDEATEGINEAVTAHNKHPRVTSITLKKADNISGTMAAVVTFNDTDTG